MNYGQLPLVALRAFEATGRHLSVKKAAENLCVTPGAVSQQIRALEARLGVELFVRANRRLALTDDGRRLLFALRESFALIDRAMSEMVGRSATLKLRLLPTFAIRWFVPRMAGFLARHPELDVEIATSSSTDDLSLDGVDFTLRYGLGGWTDVESDHLFVDELVPVCAPALASSLKRPADILQQTLLYSMMHSRMRQQAWSMWLKSVGLEGEEPNKVLRFENAALAYEAAADGMGVALAQRAYIESDVARGRLVVPFSDMVQTSLSFYFVCSRKKSDQPKIKQFRAWLRTLKESAAGTTSPEPAQGHGSLQSSPRPTFETDASDEKSEAL